MHLDGLRFLKANRDKDDKDLGAGSWLGGDSPGVRTQRKRRPDEPVRLRGSRSSTPRVSLRNHLEVPQNRPSRNAGLGVTSPFHLLAKGALGRTASTSEPSGLCVRLPQKPEAVKPRAAAPV